MNGLPCRGINKARGKACDYPATEDIIHLNVGGQLFSTSRTTLCTGVAHNSMLSALVSRDGLPSRTDALGRVFIDRDGARFAVLLNYLRCGVLTVVGDRVPCPQVAAGFVVLEDVLAEARFFGLQGLAQLVAEQLDRLALEEELEMRQLQARGDAERTNVSSTCSSSDNVECDMLREHRGTCEFERGEYDGFRLDEAF